MKNIIRTVCMISMVSGLYGAGVAPEDKRGALEATLAKAFVGAQVWERHDLGSGLVPKKWDLARIKGAFTINERSLEQPVKAYSTGPGEVVSFDGSIEFTLDSNGRLIPNAVTGAIVGPHLKLQAAVTGYGDFVGSRGRGGLVLVTAEGSIDTMLKELVWSSSYEIPASTTDGKERVIKFQGPANIMPAGASAIESSASSSSSSSSDSKLAVSTSTAAASGL